MNLNMNANLIATEISNDDPFEQSEAVRHLAVEFLKLEKTNDLISEDAKLCRKIIDEITKRSGGVPPEWLLNLSI